MRPWWEILLALIAMAALGAGCAWWYYRRDFDRGWEAHAATTSPAADEPEPELVGVVAVRHQEPSWGIEWPEDDDGSATVAWLQELAPAELEMPETLQEKFRRLVPQ
jgi:hypothetical protein